MARSATNDKTCPLCGNDNNCAMANGKSAESCWCQGVTLSEDALAAIPDASRGVHCICASCGGAKIKRNQQETP